MAKVEAFVRILNHGITDPTSGATIPFTNNNTDGTWLPSDIYDREILINSSTGLMQYRAGNTIYNVAATTGNTSGSTKVVKNAITGITQLNIKTYEIGPWDMSDTTPPNDIILIPTGLNATDVLQLGCNIFTDGQTQLYDFTTGLSSGYVSQIQLLFSGGSISVQNPAGTFFAETTPLSFFSATTNNRGIVSILYKS
jgi:hypothetical protein